MRPIFNNNGPIFLPRPRPKFNCQMNSQHRSIIQKLRTIRQFLLPHSPCEELISVYIPYPVPLGVVHLPLMTSLEAPEVVPRNETVQWVAYQVNVDWLFQAISREIQEMEMTLVKHRWVDLTQTVNKLFLKAKKKH